MALMHKHLRRHQGSYPRSAPAASTVLPRQACRQLALHHAVGRANIPRQLLQQLTGATLLVHTQSVSVSAALAAPDRAGEVSTSASTQATHPLDPPTYVTATGRIVAGKQFAPMGTKSVLWTKITEQYSFLQSVTFTVI